jgi:hypothetical protein
MNVVHDDYWPTGVKECSFDNHLLDRGSLELRLSDNGEIEASRDTARSTADI